ncbi:MAG: DUF6794 domain-containing protein [Pseudomonadota bacterium]
MPHCLWSGGPLKDWFIERNITHPDGMSGILIDLYWARLNKCQPDVEAYVRQTLPLKPEPLNCPFDIDYTSSDYQ